LGITAIDFIRLRFIEERIELQDGFILVRQALSIFLIGLGGPRDEAIQAKFACSSSANVTVPKATFQKIQDSGKDSSQKHRSRAGTSGIPFLLPPSTLEFVS
jgi:hypothetical protein